MAGPALLRGSEDDMSTDEGDLGVLACKNKVAAGVQTPPRQKSSQKRSLAEGASGSQQKQTKRGRGAKPKGDEEWKKCTTCKKFHPETQFYNSQSSCIACSLTLKSMRRVASVQGNAQWLRELESKDPDGFSSLIKEYSKERDGRAKRCRTKFSFTAYRETYVAQAGLRTEHIGEMMWRNEFIDFAKGPKLGYLTEAEAASQWEQMLLEPKRKRDDAGPRGNVRLWILTKDQVTAYDDASKQRALTQEEKVNKNATPDQLKRKLDQVFTENTGAGSSLLSSHDLLQHAMTGSSAMVDGTEGLSSFADGLLKPDIRETFLQNQQNEALHVSTACKLRKYVANASQHMCEG